MKSLTAQVHTFVYTTSSRLPSAMTDCYVLASVCYKVRGGAIDPPTRGDTNVIYKPWPRGVIVYVS